MVNPPDEYFSILFNHEPGPVAGCPAIEGARRGHGQCMKAKNRGGDGLSPRFAGET